MLLADVHLGLGTRLDDIIWALSVVQAYCKYHNVESVMVMGDLFHDRQALSIDVLCRAHAFFKQARSEGQNWAAFVGNHDMFLKHSWQVNSILPLQEVLTFIDSVKIVKMGGKRFWTLPFVYSERAYMKILSKIEERYEDGDVLLTHVGTRGAVKNICFLLQEWNIVDFTDSKFKRVYAGHFHIGQQVGSNLWYVGSLIPFKFDEGDCEHGFFVYDTETGRHEFVNIWWASRHYHQTELSAPQFRTVSDELLGDQSTDDVAGCFMRVMMTHEYSQPERQQVRDALTELGARLVTFTDSLIKKAEAPKVEQLDITQSLDMRKLFEQMYDADSKNTANMRRSLAFRLNVEVINEGDELYLDRQEVEV